MELWRQKLFAKVGQFRKICLGGKAYFPEKKFKICCFVQHRENMRNIVSLPEICVNVNIARAETGEAVTRRPSVCPTAKCSI